MEQQCNLKRKLRIGDKVNGQVEAEGGGGSAGHHLMTLRKRARPQSQSTTETRSSQVGPEYGTEGQSPEPMSMLEKDVERRLHPLLVPVVLQRVFQFCQPSVTELKNYRVVCRAWNESSSDLLRKHGVLTFHGNQWVRPNREAEGVLVQDFLQLMASDKEEGDQRHRMKPFRNVQINGLSNREDCHEMNASFLKVWKDYYAPSVTSLHISGCSLNIDELAELISAAVNLKDLIMTRNTIPIFGQQIPGNWELSLKSVTVGLGIFNGFQLVSDAEEIKLVKDANTGRVFKPTLRWLEENLMKQDGNRKSGFQNLKRLTALHDPFFWCERNSDYEELLGQLSRLQLPPLEYLAVRIRSKRESSTSCDDHLKALVTTFHGSLRTFKVFWDPILVENCEASDNFPFGLQMVEMKELFLWGNVTTSLHFLKFMSQLELLHISTYCYDVIYGNEKQIVTDFDLERYPDHPRHRFPRTFHIDLVQKVSELGFGMTGVVMTSLTHLYIDCPLSVESIGTLGVWMPHLKSLKIYVASGAHLRKICETWLELEELVLLRESLIQDEDISEGLINLKRLKRFGFDSLCKCNPTTLTEAAIHNGFLRMESLRNVTIPVHSELDPEVENALKSKCFLAPVKIIRNKKDYCFHQFFKKRISANLAR